MPFLLRFLCVLQSSILKPVGSPPPGANECLIKIILLPSCAKFQAFSYAFNCNVKMKERNKFRNREIMLLFMVDEMKVLQIYVALV